jgi:hypothetical protein
MPVMVVSPVRQHHMMRPGITPQAMEPVREIMRVLPRMWCESELAFVAELGVKELLTSVWKRTPGDCELLVRKAPHGALVGVTSFEGALPAVKGPDDGAEGGRGPYLLSAPVDELGSQPLLRGKQVWFRLSNTADGVVAEGQC